MGTNFWPFFFSPIEQWREKTRRAGRKNSLEELEWSDYARKAERKFKILFGRTEFENSPKQKESAVWNCLK